MPHAAEIQRSWSEESVTNDPLVSSLQTSLSHAVSDGLLKNTSLTGIFDLTLLNQELTKAGETTVPTS